MKFKNRKIKLGFDASKDSGGHVRTFVPRYEMGLDDKGNVAEVSLMTSGEPLTPYEVEKDPDNPGQIRIKKIPLATVTPISEAR